MACVHLKNKYSRLYLLLFLIKADFLSAALPVLNSAAAGVSPATACDSGKYSQIVQRIEQDLDPMLERAQELEQKYASDEFISKYTNIERDRALAQEAFKDKVLFGFKLPISEPEVRIDVCNRDWMMFLAVLSQWVADFVFFKMLSDALKESLQDLCLQESGKLHELLKHLDDSVEQKNSQEIQKNAEEIEHFVGKSVRASFLKFVKTGAFFALFSSAIYQIKNHYRLDAKFEQNFMDFTLMNVFHVANKKPIDGSLTEFLKDKSIGGVSFDMFQTTALDITTSFLCENGMLPAWVNGNKFDFARRATLASLFMWWSSRNIYKPVLFSFLVSNRKKIIQVLEKTYGSDLEQQNLARKELESVLQGIPQCSFAFWELNKRKNFAQWQTTLNLIVLAPVFFKAAAWVYKLLRPLDSAS